MPLKYYISRMNPSLSKLFDERGYEQCKQKKDADFVIIPGGADILPTLYGAYIHPSTNYVIEQDLADMAAWRYFGTNVPYIGVCRGAQFINAVMAGGSLYQHVTGHKTTHQIHFTRSGYSKKVSDLMNFTVSSTHHQMMIPAPDAHIYGWTHLAIGRMVY